METNESQDKSENIRRKGLHKFVHVSRWDTYVSAFGAIIFLGIIGLKVGGFEISFITWTDAFQIAILLGILGIVAGMYYRLFEERYDR